MSLIETYYSRKQLIADNLNTVGVSDASVNDGLTTLANKILNASGSKTPTILTLNTPMVVYTDVFTVTGTLTDNEENPISGATIQLIWNDGTEHIATGATGNDGVFSFTSTDPASVSSYSFQLFFAGDNDYNASNSSIVNVDTSKETSVLVITSPASGSTVLTDSVTVSGTLKDNDNTAMSGKSVSFSLNNVSAGTATVESDGTFSKTVTGLIAGSNSISASFAATTTHTAASQSITVNRSTFDGLSDLSLIAGSQILSYADEQATPGSQYATLETQLMNGESAAAISGVSVDFYRYVDGVNDVYLDSVDTDSSGQADYTYHSAGIGDIEIYGKVGSFVSKTYSIVDAKLFDPMTSNSGHWTIESGMSPSYSSNGCTVSGLSSWKCMSVSERFTVPVSMEFELVSSTRNGGGSCPIVEFNQQTHQSGNAHLWAFTDTANPNPNKITLLDKDGNLTVARDYANGVYRIDFESSTNVKVYYEDTLIYSSTNWDITNPYFTIGTGANRAFTFKNVKIKPL